MPGGLVWMRQDNLRYNRNLKPEIGQNVEFNTEYSSKYFDFRAAGFVQLISNYINQFSSTCNQLARARYYLCAWL